MEYNTTGSKPPFYAEGLEPVSLQVTGSELVLQEYVPNLAPPYNRYFSLTPRRNSCAPSGKFSFWSMMPEEEAVIK